MDYRDEAPEIIRDFLLYHETIKGHSQKTVEEYYLDLRSLFRFVKLSRGAVPPETDFNEISIRDVDLDFIKSIRVSDVYAYLTYLRRDKVKNPRAHSQDVGLGDAARARKVATIRSFYKYLTVKKNLLSENPMQDLDSPKVAKTLPRYLSLAEAQQLLRSIDGKFKERDTCLLTIFLNCGLRISEIVGLNLADLRPDHLRVMGKGSKERVVYLNDACIKALADYLLVRNLSAPKDEKALFLSNRRSRMSRESVHSMVKKRLLEAGLDASRYSSHKLRHTAATLMLQNGVDVRTLQEVLGHEHLNTTQIYTHVDSSELRIAAAANPLADFDPSKKNEENS